MISRRTVLGLAGAAVIGGALASARRTLTLLTGAPAGSSGDDIARSFAGFLGKALDGTDVQVRNAPGDGGRTALNALAAAAPTGSTVGWVVTPVLSARAIDREDPELPSRITLLGAVQREPIAFVGNVANPPESVQDIVQRASRDAGSLALGTPPPGSAPHLAALRLQVMTQTHLNIVAFPSAAAARQALLGGNVAAAVLGLSDVIAALRDDKLAGLGIAARTRTGIVPDMPLLKEAGVPLSAWIRRGLAVPLGTPDEVIAPLIKAARKIADDSAFREECDARGLLAAWSDQTAWTAQVEHERLDLSALWAADPWLSATGQ